jgi:hypothetical protein
MNNQTVQPKTTLTWAELKVFANKLTPQQLAQPVLAMGEPGGAIESVTIFEEDFINPSGEGPEPVSVYEQAVGDDVKEEPVVIAKGEIRLWLV